MPDFEETATQKYRMRLAQLREEQETEGWRAMWKDINEWMLPRKGEYLSSDEKDSRAGTKKEQKIINGSAHDALRTLAAGMQGGLTSPSRPWFRLSLPDQDLQEFGPVRDWLHQSRDRMLYMFARSNFYGAMHTGYAELSAFGTNAMLLEEDFKTYLRCRPFTIGEFMLSQDSSYRVDTMYRQFSLTARQLVDEFKKENVSDAVLEAVRNNQLGRRFEVAHCIQPNRNYNADKRGPSGKTFESVYFEIKGDADKVLRRGGYESLPFVAPRWDVTGTNVYGNSPGMTALGDTKMLQKLEEKKLKALDKMVDPPMNAPTSMRGKGGTIVAGGVNYIDVQQGNQGFTPTYQVNPNLQNMAFEIDRVEQRIRRFFFNDLFLAVLSEDKNMTATEVAKRYEEKLVVLGPVIERLQSEILDTVIDRAFEIGMKLGVIAPPPKELEGMNLSVDYIGLLSQAQKIVSTTAIEKTAAFVVSLAPVKPDIIDKFDFDEAVDQYADAVGASPRVVVPDDKLGDIREARAKQAAQQQAAAMAQPAQQMSQAAKNMSETEVGDMSMLDVLGGGGQ